MLSAKFMTPSTAYHGKWQRWCRMFIEWVIYVCFRNGSAISLSAPPITALITPEPVRHCRIPELPLDGSLLFEFLFFIYLLVALFIQYINIYKTVWWYPYNHPASCTSLVSSPANAITHPFSLYSFFSCFFSPGITKHLTLSGWRGVHMHPHQSGPCHPPFYRGENTWKVKERCQQDSFSGNFLQILAWTS